MKARFATFFFLGVLVMLPFLFGANEKGCTLPTCTDGQVQCSGNEIQTCQNGAWVNTTDCSTSGGVCQNGACVGCRTATDCTGALPQLCQVCNDGSDGCAHWTCQAGTCQIAYCGCVPPPCPLSDSWDPIHCACIPKCTEGTVSTGMCCLSAGDFPNTCPVTPCVCPSGQVCNCPMMPAEACGCSAENSHEVKVCNCPPNTCFNGIRCVPIAVCTDGQVQCSGNEVQTCQNGAWINTTDCSASGAVCQNGACVGCRTAADCTGPLPLIACRLCPYGGDECPHWTCQAGVCTIAYCACPASACPQGQIWDSYLCNCVPGCKTAADCTGPLPQLCQLCPGGGNGCAHWTCPASICQIAYCP